MSIFVGVDRIFMMMWFFIVMVDFEFVLLHIFSSSLCLRLVLHLVHMNTGSNAIDTLSGLDQHQFVSTLLLADNAIDNMESLVVLQSLPRLATLDLHGNPIEQMDNYRARVIYMYDLFHQMLIFCF
jgi:hypothetical protein